VNPVTVNHATTNGTTAGEHGHCVLRGAEYLEGEPIMISIIIRNWRKATLLLVAAGTAATISACVGGGGSSAADFCGQLQTMSVKFAGLQNNPTKSLISQAARAAQGLEGSAPSAISGAVKTQADAIAAWAKTGVPPNALGTGPYAAANDQINAWTSATCKQSG